MKNLTITINEELRDINITVANGRKFTDAFLSGEYHKFNISVNNADLERIKKYAVKNADDKSSNKGNWYAHCNGFSMGLMVTAQNEVTINTYVTYRRESK